MFFLKNLVAWIVLPIFQWVVEKLVRVIGAWIRFKKKEHEIEQKNQEVLDQTEKAQTKEERKDAAKSVIDNF